MLKPVTTRTDVEFVPADERESDQPTTLVGRALSKEELAAIVDALEERKVTTLENRGDAEDGGGGNNRVSIETIPAPRASAVMLDVGLMSLRAVKNFRDEHGRELQLDERSKRRTAFGLEREMLESSAVGALPFRVLSEYAGWLINECSELSEADRGNY